MRILMLSAFYYPYVGGAEVFAQVISERLSKENNEVIMVTGNWGNIPKQENINGVEVYRTAGFNAKHFRLVSNVIPSILKAREFKFDLINAHQAFSAGFAGALLKQISKKPLVTTVQGGDLADYREGTGKFGGVLSGLIGWGLSRADIVHGVSSYTCKRSSELGAKKTILIPNGVDVDKFSQLAKNKDVHLEGDPVIISTSRLTEKNGLHYLINAMPALLKEKPNTKLYIIGEGEQRKELENLVNTLKLNSSINLMGNVKHHLIPQYLCVSDIFIRPSINEGFGISFIEAMACEVATIGTSVGGIVDIIDNMENGLLLPPNNIPEIEKALILLSEDESLRKKLAKAGRKKTIEKFNWDIVYNQMKELYKSLI